MPLANTGQAASEVLQRLRRAASVVVDVETSGLNPHKCYPIGYVITFGPTEAESFYCPLRHAGGGNLEHGEQRFETAEAVWTASPFEAALMEALRGKRIIAHNAGFDLSFMPGLDTTQSTFNDTLVAAYLVDELRPGFSLAECCQAEGVQAKKGEQLYQYLNQVLGVPNAKASMGSYWQTNAEATIVHEYATGDGVSTWQLWAALTRKIEEQQLEKVWRIESRLLPVLSRMRARGIKVDREQLARVIAETEVQYAIAHRVVGELNVRSSKDVKGFLEGHGVFGWPLTEKGAPNFSEKWLLQSEPGRAVVAARKYRTLLDSFLRPLVSEHLVGDRIHSEIHQCRDENFGTVTGRMSTTAPNLSALPGKRQGERGRFYRTAFVPDVGEWVEADFKAAEVRIACHYSKAKLWQDGFANGTDPHTAVANALGISRPHAKTISLGLIMGMGPSRLAGELGIPLAEGKAVVSRYFEGLPELRRLQHNASEVYRQRGYVKSISNRRFRLEDPKWAFRAVNRLTQGGCADLLKSRLVEMDSVARAYPDTHLLLSIYDSVSWQTADPEADKALQAAMTGELTSEIQFDVPMAIDVGRGASWGAATFAESE